MSPYVATKVIVVLRDGRRFDITGVPLDQVKRRLRRLRVKRGDIKALERHIAGREEG